MKISYKEKLSAVVANMHNAAVNGLIDNTSYNEYLSLLVLEGVITSFGKRQLRYSLRNKEYVSLNFARELLEESRTDKVVFR